MDICSYTILINVVINKGIIAKVNNIFTTYIVRIVSFTLNVVQRNTLFGQKNVYSIVFRLVSVEKMKINGLIIITDALGIHEHLSSLKILASCFSTMIFPKFRNMWKMES